LSVNSVDGQKQATSLFEAHLGIDSQVFIHLGTRLGHGARVPGELGLVSEGTTGEDGSPALVVTAGGRSGTETGALSREASVVVISQLAECRGPVSVGWLGQIVVDSTYVEVTTTVECAGHSVTLGAQLVTVISAVVHTVEVVSWGVSVGHETSDALEVGSSEGTGVVMVGMVDIGSG
jgi:hypothetical protein